MREMSETQMDGLEGGFFSAECGGAIRQAAAWASLGPIGSGVGIYLIVTSC